MNRPPWYAPGLRFSCTQCGSCCTGEPGSVLVSESEERVLAERLGLSPEQFRIVYARTIPSGRVLLRERANGDCVFWHAKHGCTVYEDRPRQCRTWPFWRRNLKTPETWAEASRGCPGMDRGERHDLRMIEQRCSADGTLSSAAEGTDETSPDPQ